MWISSTCYFVSDGLDSLRSSRLREYFPLIYANLLELYLPDLLIFFHLSSLDDGWLFLASELQDFDMSLILCTLSTFLIVQDLDCSRLLALLPYTLCAMALVLLRFCWLEPLRFLTLLCPSKDFLFPS
jgi:hypothetical protein